jgi:hypothetical protein
MHAAYMATKTISIDLEAHRKLSAARRTPKESFSQVIRRASFAEEGPMNGGRLLQLMQELEPVDPAVIEALEAGQTADRPPEDSWDG